METCEADGSVHVLELLSQSGVAASPGMIRGRLSLIVDNPAVRTCGEEQFDDCFVTVQRSRVQRREAALLARVGICPSSKQRRNQRAGMGSDCTMQGAKVAPVGGCDIRIGAGVEEQPDNLVTIEEAGKMESGETVVGKGIHDTSGREVTAQACGVADGGRLEKGE